jgi:hypothetical protein
MFIRGSTAGFKINHCHIVTGRNRSFFLPSVSFGHENVAGGLS